MDLLSSESSSDEAPARKRGGARARLRVDRSAKRRLDAKNISALAADVSEASDSSSSSESSEDSDAAALTETLDVDVHRTIAMIREKDPRIYDDDVVLYRGVEAVERATAPKTVTYEDVRRRALKRGVLEDVVEEGPSDYVIGERKAKSAFVEKAAAGDESDDSDVFVEKPVVQEDVGDEHNSELARLAEKTIESDFLKTFVSTRAWKKPIVEDEDSDSESSLSDSKVDDFERRHNFRFEEAGSSNVVSHPRHTADGARKQEPATRKKKRERSNKNKKAELRAQLESLRSQKQAEFRKELALIAGDSEKRLSNAKSLKMLLDEEFDPEKHDAAMARLFDDEYYAGDDEEFEPPSDFEEEDEGVFEAPPQQARKKLKTVFADKLKEDVERAKLTKGFKFSYTKTTPNDHGLTTEEILTTEDSLLNSYVSLKRLAPYRPSEWYSKPYHRNAFRMKARKAQDTRATREPRSTKTPEERRLATYDV